MVIYILVRTCIIFDEPYLSSRHHLLRGEDPVVTPETVNMFCKLKYFSSNKYIFYIPDLCTWDTRRPPRFVPPCRTRRGGSR